MIAARAGRRLAVLPFFRVACLLLASTWPMPDGRAAADDVSAFMTQSACVDAKGAVQTGRLPFEPGCGSTRPLSAGEPLPYRKHDWPGAVDAPTHPRGYQASDSLRGSLLGRPAIVQTFDFGGGQRAFSRFDQADGGQMVTLRDGAAASPMTEDGGGGMQWFQAPECRPGEPVAGWLFAAPPLSGDWRERVVRLNRTRGPDRCPTAFDLSLTRWRTARIHLPWKEAGHDTISTAVVDALVSEHFAGDDIGKSPHLERFWFVRGLGLTRWERWEHSGFSRLPGWERRADLTAASGRCPSIDLGAAPGEGWRLADCRFWTNMVRAAPDDPLSALDWPPPNLR